jgi:hypothetical protein
MTVKQLRDALALLAEKYQDHQVVIWAPGTTYKVARLLGVTDDRVILGANPDLKDNQ